ncbi:MAG: hypothetical protein ACFNLC_02120 [Prevotella denticola]
MAPVVSAADTAGAGMQHGGMMVMWEYDLGFSNAYCHCKTKAE